MQTYASTKTNKHAYTYTNANTRELRTHLDLVRPSSENEVLTYQAYQVQGKDRHACVREFQEDEKVMVKNYRNKESFHS